MSHHVPSIAGRRGGEKERELLRVYKIRNARMRIFRATGSSDGLQ